MNKNNINLLFININKSFFYEIEKINKNSFFSDNLLNSTELFFSKDINFLITEISSFNDLNQLELFRTANKNMPIIIFNKTELSFPLLKHLYSFDIKGFYIINQDENLLLKRIIETMNDYNNLLREKKFLSMLNNVMDSHKDIIFSIEHEDILYANKKFFEFFQVDSLKSFHSKYISLQNLILKNNLAEVYLDKHLTTIDFIEHLYSLKEEHRTIALKDNIKGDIKIFMIKISFIKEGYRLFNLVDITDMAKKHSILEEKAHIDALTKIFNRHKFNDILNSLEQDYSLLMIDIDKFKSINDSFGHDLGDIVLREVANIIKSNIRRTDIFARWGGEEFILVLPETSYDVSLKIADSIREKIFKSNIEYVGPVSISIGVSHSSFGSSLETIRQLADKALYIAKEKGRNKVIGSLSLN